MLTEIRGYGRAWDKVRSSNSPYDCGYAVCKYYEIPADTENKAQTRGGNAQKWFGFLAQAIDSGASPVIIQEAPAAAPAQELDEDGVPVPVTWPPRMIDARCDGWPEVKLLQATLVCRGYSVPVDGLWSKTLTEKRFFEWHEDDVSVTLRNRGGSYGGGSEVLVVEMVLASIAPNAERTDGTISPTLMHRAGTGGGPTAHNNFARGRR